ncbi:MAG TPA: glycosyltransferase family A protein [Aggregatilinea sp.]|uniref:glycosyltransferase family 2 protein n=1 Tax=Aggregatilinea sp. TaxID=2806333 RepID=UPI002BC6E164|nr:glycosyltransferase family A protein [Aggregatilinea sp.]HML20686.1 glycosyltransferase family A protein [Aggregatilinea sp.]
MSDLPRVSFGMIVLNGEPFVRYNLRALYPFAHEIIVVEGAAPAAADVATLDGHSLDGTLETLRRFKAEEDPDDKLQIVTRDGLWTGEKDEMSQAYAERATGDYLWQVDSDEFYRPQDMQAVLDLLRDDPSITAVSFKTRTFWGGFESITDGYYLRDGGDEFHRLFKWGPGYHYTTHRPPTVVDDQGRDLHDLHWIDGATLARHGIVMYHYSLVFPKQVFNKSSYYDRAAWVARSGYGEWAEGTFLRLEDPFHVHNVYTYPSWLERYRGPHPEQIEALRRDLAEGVVSVEQRPTDDIDRLLRSPRYILQRAALKFRYDSRPARARLRRTLALPKRIARRAVRALAAR